MSTQQKSVIDSKVETQNNSDSDKKIQKEVPYHMKPKIKPEEKK
jgi:hypothetical protein